MKQPLLAPVAAGGAILTGVSAMLISGYRIADCFQYRDSYGFCNRVVEENTLSLVAGGSAIVGSFGGLFTYNRRLERPDTKELLPAVALNQEPVPPSDPTAEEVLYLHHLGYSQNDIAEQLGITRYKVRKYLSAEKASRI